MTRQFTIIALLAFSLPAVAQTAEPAAPTLKADVIVMGDLVRIGDLVENAGAVADVPIFRAPDLGQSGGVPASRVADAVRPYHIMGLNTRGLAEVMVTRASRAIAPKEFEDRLVRALSGQYGLADAKSLTVIFDNEPRLLQVEPASGDLRVARLTFEPRNGRFDVSFELPGSAAARRAPLRFTGSLTETFEAAVPVRALAQGEVLRATDLTLARRPKAEFAAGAVTTLEQAIGLAARRALAPGHALRRDDLQRPELVARNESVSITYEVPGILLTMRGQALEAGAQGDVINVLNAQSKKTIQATITGPGRVSVAATTPRLAANTVPSLSRNSVR
jgi:flagella basal body P-ring formation protein FlgA